MRNRATSLQIPAVSLPMEDLGRNVDGWLLDCEIRQHSHRTLQARRALMDLLTRFAGRHEYTDLGAVELRQFLAYLTRGDSGGTRWGRPMKPAKPSTVETYHGHLRTFFSWLVAEGVIEASPMENVAPPIVRADQIQPFTPDQVSAIIRAAQKSDHPLRDEAIVKVLLDTGMRVSELCGLTIGTLDLHERKCRVLGKGGKERSVYFGSGTTKALYNYLNLNVQKRNRAKRALPLPSPHLPLFLAEGGHLSGDGLTRSGIEQIIRRLGRSAGIRGVRCSPHTFRHTFAVEFLRAGGNQFSLMQILGHTGVQMTARYVQFAQADIERQQRQYSPVDRLRRR